MQALLYFKLLNFVLAFSTALTLPHISSLQEKNMFQITMITKIRPAQFIPS